MVAGRRGRRSLGFLGSWATGVQAPPCRTMTFFLSKSKLCQQGAQLNIEKQQETIIYNG